MSSNVLHVARPFATESEYLAAEAWTIEARGMLLFTDAVLEPNSIIVFDLTLEGGARPIRAEVRVGPRFAATEEHASGVRVFFRRFGSQTKAFIDRALAAREQQLAGADAPSLVPEPAAADTRVTEAEAAAPAVALAEQTNIAPRALERSSQTRSAREPSGIHRRPPTSILPPPNREELLSRLRARAKVGPSEARSEKLGSTG